MLQRSHGLAVLRSHSLHRGRRRRGVRHLHACHGHRNLSSVVCIHSCGLRISFVTYIRGSSKSSSTKEAPPQSLLPKSLLEEHD